MSLTLALTHTILVIGGSDSSGGAGISRDTATAAALGVEARPVLTAVTAQTDHAVTAIHPVPPELIAAQITAAREAPIGAVKIGMLGSEAAADAVARALSGGPAPVVIDPVLRASSGGVLTRTDRLPALFSRATLLTPNLPELAALTGTTQAGTEAEILRQARQLRAQSGAGAVLAKGGHFGGNESTDWLVTAEGATPLTAPRLATGRRGTGCALSTAIACRLAQGDPLLPACRSAKAVIHDWIAAAP